MTIARVHGVNDGSITPAAGFTTISLTPAANALIIVQFFSDDSASGDPGTPSVTGNGITYSLLGRQNLTGGIWAQVFYGLSSAPTTGGITMSFSRNQNQVLWDVEWFTGVASTGLNGADALGTPQTNQSAGVTSMSVTLPALQAGSISYGYMTTTRTNQNFTPGSGYTDTFGLNSTGSLGSHEGEVNPSGSTTVNYTYGGSSLLALLGVEIKAAPSVTTPQIASVVATWPTEWPKDFV